MDLVTGVDEYLASGLLPYYYGLVAVCALYLLHKFKYKTEAIFIIMLFFEGLFVFLSATIPLLTNLHKIGFSLFAVLLYLKPAIKSKKSNLDFLIIGCFCLIGLAFFISYLQNDSNILTSLSQLMKKYCIPLLFYFGVKSHITNENKMEWYADLFTWLIIMQIPLQFVKLVLFGSGESLIGSISFLGGGASNIVPILGFFFIWVKQNGVLKNKDWFIVILLFLSAVFIGNKRSVVFTLPIIIIYINTFVGKTFNAMRLIKVLPIILVIAIIGVKTNPTLNPENSRWGSFDIKYVFDYAYDYSFGESRAKLDVGYGRGQGTIYFINTVKSEFDTKEMLFGIGVDEVLTEYADFDSIKYGISSKGSAGAFVQNFIALGLLGTVAIFIFGLLLANIINDRMLFWGFTFLLLFEYFLLYNSIISINACAILFIFICNYFNYKRFYFHSA